MDENMQDGSDVLEGIAFVGETTGSFDSIMVLGAGLAAVSILAIVVAKATAKKLVWED